MLFPKNSATNYVKSNTWNIRPLIDDSFFPATKRNLLKIVGFIYLQYILSILQLCYYACLSLRSPPLVNHCCCPYSQLAELSYLVSTAAVAS